MAAKARRKINPTTGDYVQSAGGIAADTGVESQIILALSTRRGSCLAYPSFGSRLHEVQKADVAGRRLAQFYATEALEHVRQRVKDLVVIAEPGVRPGQIALRVDYRLGDETRRVTYTREAG